MCNKDLSFELYQKYFSLTNIEIEITLKDSSILKGKILGYFYDNENSNPQISKWHIANTNCFLGIDAFGFLEGEIILHKNISSIYFYEDKSILKF
jgi:hypothetical protein